MNRVFSVLGAQELSGVFDLRPDNVIQTFHNVTVHFDQEGYVWNLLALTSQLVVSGSQFCIFCVNSTFLPRGQDLHRFILPVMFSAPTQQTRGIDPMLF